MVHHQWNNFQQFSKSFLFWIDHLRHALFQNYFHWIAKNINPSHLGYQCLESLSAAFSMLPPLKSYIFQTNWHIIWVIIWWCISWNDPWTRPLSYSYLPNEFSILVSNPIIIAPSFWKSFTYKFQSSWKYSHLWSDQLRIPWPNKFKNDYDSCIGGKKIEEFFGDNEVLFQKI